MCMFNILLIISFFSSKSNIFTYNKLLLVIYCICLIIYKGNKILIRSEIYMINYENCWKTMYERGITKYSLIYHYNLSSNTLRRMSKGEPITTSTINELCLILHCRREDILSFELTTEEEAYQKQRELEIAEKKKK